MATAEKHRQVGDEGVDPRRGMWPQRWRWRVSVILLAIIALGMLAAWVTRDRIAGNVIDDVLDSNGLKATYDIVAIDPRRQTIANLVIGDPSAPDFTAERIVFNLDYGLRTPSIEGIELVQPRLYGSYIDGELSFGTLDPLIFAESDEPPGLPTTTLTINDGRALIESDYGPIALKLDGSGRLNDGFRGKVAVTAPGFGTSDCETTVATGYGDITTNAGTPSFSGPVRLRGAQCSGGFLTSLDATVDLTLGNEFDSIEGSVTAMAEGTAFSLSTTADTGIAEVSGEAKFRWGSNGLVLTHDFTADRVGTAYGSVRRLTAEGSLRSDANFDRSDWTMELGGEGFALTGDSSTLIMDARRATEGTLLNPLIAKFERNFARIGSDAGLSADVVLRRTGETTTLVIPQAKLTSPRGGTVAAVSRFSALLGDGIERLSGNFLTGGKGLPRIRGRMEQSGDGLVALRASMAEYAQGPDRIAVPRLLVTQNRRGQFSFDSLIRASGALPGGSISSLEIPLSGSWSDDGGLRAGERCVIVRFGAFELYQLALQSRSLALCPPAGGTMIAYDDALRVNVASRDLQLDGNLAGSPASLAAETLAVSYPGGFSLSEFAGIIGEEGNAVRLTAEALEGTTGAGLGGTFSNGTAALDAVPLDLSQLNGRWAYRDDALLIGEGAFMLTDRAGSAPDTQARFEPLVARGATLSLLDGIITANARLSNPASDRLVTIVDVEHDLAEATGRARIDVPALLLDERLRPQDLSYLTLGVVAFADGTVTGEGLITWENGEVQSSGTFSTDGLDLAATFGPIDDVRGTVEFTDLLNLTTAPDQVLEIGSVNPGIEVLAGRVRYSLTDGELIQVADARWPFMGGELILRPVDIDYGGTGSQRYVFEIVGLDAAVFVTQMEIGNIGATGVFDGSVPITFDEDGNGYIDGGLLISRTPGGNVAYVGELLYEDMGAIANYAFQSLRSLDYNQMSVGLDGSLAGEIVTSFRIDGVRQGQGASRNFVTRQLGKIPIRFNINVRSQNFYQLATMVRSFFDAEYLGNPVDRGLLRAREGQLVPLDSFIQPRAPEPPSQSNDLDGDETRRDDELPVQPPESDKAP